jgi:hypothetical protein
MRWRGWTLRSFMLGNELNLIERDRWIWPLAPGQRHLIEALAIRRIKSSEFPCGNDQPLPPPQQQGP